MAESLTNQQSHPRNLVELHPAPLLADSAKIAIPDSIPMLIAIPDTAIVKDSITLPVFSTHVDSILQAERSFTKADSLYYGTVKQPGLPGSYRIQSPATSIGFSAVILLALFLTTCAFSLNTRFYGQFIKNLFSSKERISALFESSLTGFQFKSCLTIQTILLESLIFYELIRNQIYDTKLHPNYILILTAFVAIIAIYHLIRAILFLFLGNIFTSKTNTQNYISEYFALLGLWGTWLLPTSILMIFTHINIYILAALLLIPGIIIRILTIKKGVMIFFRKSDGIFYIILYLCALEIMPAIVLFQALIAAFSKF